MPHRPHNPFQAPKPTEVPTQNNVPTISDVVGAVSNAIEAIATVVPSAKTAVQMSKLSVAADTLNRLSDELTKEVSEIEATLNALNLGVRTEVKAITLGSDPDIGYFHWLNLAYGKKSGKWGFIVEEWAKSIDNPDEDTYDSWPFKDAPREFRLQVVDSIPELLDALWKESDNTATKITQKVKFVKDLSFSVPKTSQQGSKK
jgi:hypothetical protein